MPYIKIPRSLCHGTGERGTTCAFLPKRGALTAGSRRLLAGGAKTQRLRRRGGLTAPPSGQLRHRPPAPAPRGSRGRPRSGGAGTTTHPRTGGTRLGCTERTPTIPIPQSAQATGRLHLWQNSCREHPSLQKPRLNPSYSSSRSLQIGGSLSQYILCQNLPT